MFKLCKNVKLGSFFFFIQLVQLFMIKVLRYCLVADFLYIYSIFLKTSIFLFKFYFIILCASCTLQHFFFKIKNTKLLVQFRLTQFTWKLKVYCLNGLYYLQLNFE
jgi:hypothetical protein